MKATEACIILHALFVAINMFECDKSHLKLKGSSWIMKDIRFSNLWYKHSAFYRNDFNILEVLIEMSLT